MIADGPAPGSWTGVTGLAEGTREFLRAWEGYRGEAEEYREIDDGRVLVLTDRTGRGRTSGLELAQMHAQGVAVFHVRNGKVTRLVFWFDRERGMAELGLAPETGAS